MTRVIDEAAAHRAELPAELPRKAAATPIGIFLAWCVERGLTSAWHGDAHADAFRRVQERLLTGRDYLLQFLDGRLTDQHLGRAAQAFARDYYLTGDYLADYEATLCRGLPSRYHVPDRWESVDTLAPVLDDRFEVWRAPHAPAPAPPPPPGPQREAEPLPAPEPEPEPVPEPEPEPPPPPVFVVEQAAGDVDAAADAAEAAAADDDAAADTSTEDEGAYEPIDPAAFAAWATSVQDDRRPWLPTEPGRPPRHAPHPRRRRAWRRPVSRARWGAILVFALLWSCAQCARQIQPASSRITPPVERRTPPRPFSPRRTR